MNLQNQLKKPTLDQEEYFYVNSDNLDLNVQFIKERSIENVMLIPNEEGYNLKEVDFFKELTFLKKVQMGACSQMENYEGITYLKNLIHLTFNANKNVDVDLSNLGDLKEIYFSYSTKIEGLEKLKKLETISVGSGIDSFFDIEVFQNYHGLKTLIISLSIIENALDFLKNNSNLEYLEFNHMKREFSIKGIEHLKTSLKRLKFISSKKINNIDLIGQLKNLEWLILSESVPLESTEVIKDLNKLSALTVSGSSYFKNGDLRSLRHKRDTLEHYFVKSKKHYYYH